MYKLFLIENRIYFCKKNFIQINILFLKLRLLLVFAGSQCPQSDGKFMSDEQCDAYIECTDGVAVEKLCPDGLLFTQRNETDGDCTWSPLTICKNRTRLQDPNPTNECPRQFGFYRIGDEDHCGQYHNCAHGVATLTKCLNGLAFNKETYRCDWPDLVSDCNVEAFLGFTCPPPINTNDTSERNQEAEVDTEDGKLRYFRNPKVCRTYFACVNGRPRLYSCGKYLAFNEETGLCDHYVKIPECYQQLKEMRKERQIKKFKPIIISEK